MPGDDKMQLVWGSVKTKKMGLVAAPVDGVMLCILQAWGILCLTIALLKLTTVFTHTSEGTFLRRNLLIVFGVCNIAFAASFYKNAPFIYDNYGADNTPYAALLTLEGVVYLADALLRPRKIKK